MSTLVIRGVSDQLHAKLKMRAREARRSVNQEVVHLIEASVLSATPDVPSTAARVSNALCLSSDALEAALADTRFRHYASLDDLNGYMDELRADRTTAAP